MIKKFERIPPRVRVLITFASIIIILACIVSIMNHTWRDKRDRFIHSAEETLDMYGDSIDSCRIDNTYVGVYVNSRKWNNTSEETKDAFIKEVYALIRMDAINANYLKGNVITLSFYNGNDRIALYNITE